MNENIEIDAAELDEVAGGISVGPSAGNGPPMETQPIRLEGPDTQQPIGFEDDNIQPIGF